MDTRDHFSQPRFRVPLVSQCSTSPPWEPNPNLPEIRSMDGLRLDITWLIAPKGPMDTQMNRLRRTPKNRHLDFADNRKGFEEIIVVPGGTGATSRIDDYQYSPRARRRIGSDLQVSGDGSRPFEVQPTAELDDLDVTIDLERWSVNTRESELRVPVVRRLGFTYATQFG